MKKQILIVLTVSMIILSISSCKKWYVCTCTTNGGTVYWTGDVEGTSKTQATNAVKNGDCSGYNVSCK